MVNRRRRVAIIELHNVGTRNCDIARQLHIPSSRVSETIRRYQQLGTTEDRPRSGRPRSVNTPRNRSVIRKKITRNPRRSMRRMALELGVSRESVRTIIKKEFKLHPYKFQKAHFLDDKMKAKRLQRCRLLQHRAANNAHRKILFTDESLFTIEQLYNKQNDRILAPNVQAANSGGRIVSRRAHPLSTMVWAGISAHKKTPLVFIASNVKINKDVYRQQVLEPLRDEWAPVMFPDGVWTLQQDSAPAHKAKLTQDFCRDNFPDFITTNEWAPNSPDLNPLDYSIWAILKTKACATPHRSVEALQAALRQAWDEITPEMLRAAVDEFPKRLSACIRAKGGHFEIV